MKAGLKLRSLSILLFDQLPPEFLTTSPHLRLRVGWRSIYEPFPYIPPLDRCHKQRRRLPEYKVFRPSQRCAQSDAHIHIPRRTEIPQTTAVNSALFGFQFVDDLLHAP